MGAEELTGREVLAIGALRGHQGLCQARKNNASAKDTQSVAKRHPLFSAILGPHGCISHRLQCPREESNLRPTV